MFSPLLSLSLIVLSFALNDPATPSGRFLSPYSTVGSFPSFMFFINCFNPLSISIDVSSFFGLTPTFALFNSFNDSIFGSMFSEPGVDSS